MNPKLRKTLAGMLALMLVLTFPGATTLLAGDTPHEESLLAFSTDAIKLYTETIPALAVLDGRQIEIELDSKQSLSPREAADASIHDLIGSPGGKRADLHAMEPLVGNKNYVLFDMHWIDQAPELDTERAYAATLAETIDGNRLKSDEHDVEIELSTVERLNFKVTGTEQLDAFTALVLTAKVTINGESNLIQSFLDPTFGAAVRYFQGLSEDTIQEVVRRSCLYDRTCTSLIPRDGFPLVEMEYAMDDGRPAPEHDDPVFLAGGTAVACSRLDNGECTGECWGANEGKECKKIADEQCDCCGGEAVGGKGDPPTSGGHTIVYCGGEAVPWLPGQPDVPAPACQMECEDPSLTCTPIDGMCECVAPSTSCTDCQAYELEYTYPEEVRRGTKGHVQFELDVGPGQPPQWHISGSHWIAATPFVTCEGTDSCDVKATLQFLNIRKGDSGSIGQFGAAGVNSYYHDIEIITEITNGEAFCANATASGNVFGAVREEPRLVTRLTWYIGGAAVAHIALSAATVAALLGEIAVGVVSHEVIHQILHGHTIEVLVIAQEHVCGSF
ncbi:hypothetical protein ABI59_13390 [Acidobacteria bacterium Mor1]|nr:hypothetical protein ABI59_13390 [Acidobacteria bacterium Mor1]